MPEQTNPQPTQQTSTQTVPPLPEQKPSDSLQTGSTQQQEPPPPDPMEAVNKLATQQQEFLQAQQQQLLQQQTALQNSVPEPALPAPPTEEEIAHAINEGDGVKAAALMRQFQEASQAATKVEQDRLVREANAQLSGLTREVVLQRDEYYQNDAAIKKETDTFLDQMSANGYTITAELAKAAVDRAVGNNRERLLLEAREIAVRQHNEQHPVQPGGVIAPEPVTELDGYNIPTLADLGADAEMSLQVLNDGRGKTLDQYAQDLPARRVKEIVVGEDGRKRVKNTKKRYENWADYQVQGQKNRDILREQQDRYFGD